MRALFLSFAFAAFAARAALVPLTPEGAQQWRDPISRARDSLQFANPEKAFEFIPRLVGTVFAGGDALKLSTPCFASVTVSLDAAGNGLSVKVGKHAHGHKLMCQTGYVFGFVGAVDIEFFKDTNTEHNISLEGSYSDEMLWDLHKFGVRVFEFNDGLVATADELLATVRLLAATLIGYDIMPQWVLDDNLNFLKARMNYTMEKREIQRVDIPESELHPGDLVILTRLAGLSAVVMWAMGTHVGHEAIIIEIDGVMSVCESNIGDAIWNSEIDCGPWADYLERCAAQDYNVAVVPLAPKYRAAFNNTAAYEWIKTVKGLPYGWHNILMGWFDTPDKNFPQHMSQEFVQILMTTVDWLLQDVMNAGPKGDLFLQAWNHRIGTKGLKPSEIYYQAAQKGISFGQLISIPEKDGWIYQNGKDAAIAEGPSIICCVLVASSWKAGGLFGEYTDQIQATEWTLYDTYSANFFDSDYKNNRPKACIEADPELPFCQVLGRYRMTLEDTWNTVPITPHMKEKCESENPLYIRSPGC